MRKQTPILTFPFLFAVTLCAQIPDTPAGRQFSAWQKAQDSGDRGTIQQFIEKSMPWGRADQELAIHNQTGGYEVKKVEQSSDTSLVVLAQERGGARQFVRITFNTSATDASQIAGIRIQLAQPPPDLAPPKLTASEAEAARSGAPFRQFSAWLEAFNSGDRNRMSDFLKAYYPSANLDG